MADDVLKRLEGVLEHFTERETRAKERLTSKASSEICFGIVGLSADFDECEIATNVRLRRVSEPSGEVELARAMINSGLFSAVARHSHNVTFELSIDRKEEASLDAHYTLAWLLISAIRATCICDFLVPIASNTSFDTISAFSDKSLDIRLIEDTPRTLKLMSKEVLSRDDIQWISTHWEDFTELMNNESFKTAVDGICLHHQHASTRMAVASI